jgi:hypothetical protein
VYSFPLGGGGTILLTGTDFSFIDSAGDILEPCLDPQEDELEPELTAEELSSSENDANGASGRLLVGFFRPGGDV